MSVGLAVFNGERYLEEAIDSILAQTFRDFELIICDNASTDRTAEICRRAAEGDDRVRYFRNARNIGGANNENLTFTHARGRYFRWAAHDDVLAPQLLERCVEALDANPEVVLCHPWVIHIDENGDEIRRVTRRRAPDLPAWKLFVNVSRFDNRCEEIYGLMRSDALAATGLQRNYTDSDRTLLAHMALLGRFYEVDDYLFSRRFHPETSTVVFPEWRGRMRWFGDEYAEKITLPHWSQLHHYLQLIWSSPASVRTKICCYAYVPVWILTYRRWRSLGRDLLLAGIATWRLWQRQRREHP